MPKFSPRLRVQKIFEQIKRPDTLVLANGAEPHLDASFFYITGFPYGLFENSFLVAERSGKISLVTSLLEEPIARAHSTEIEIFAEPDSDHIRTRLTSIAGKEPKSIALNSSELTYSSFLTIKSACEGAKLVDASEAFE